MASSGSIPVQGSVPAYGNLRFEGSIPVVGEIPVEAQVGVDNTFPVNSKVDVDGNLTMEGSIPLNATLQVNTTVPVSCQPKCGGELEYTATLPLRGSIPIDANLPFATALPIASTPVLAPTEAVSVQRFIKAAPKKELAVETVSVERIVKPQQQPPKPKERIVAPPRYPSPPHVAPVVVATPAYVDPRPLLQTESEKAHDFEYHREGGYAARKSSVNTVPHASNAYGGLATGPIVDPAIAPIVPSDADRAWTHQPSAPVGIDSRPPLKIETEKVHDFEVHREGGYAKGHTFVGANPSNLQPVASGPAADSRRAYGGVGPSA